MNTKNLFIKKNSKDIFTLEDGNKKIGAIYFGKTQKDIFFTVGDKKYIVNFIADTKLIPAKFFAGVTYYSITLVDSDTKENIKDWFFEWKERTGDGESGLGSLKINDDIYLWDHHAQSLGFPSVASWYDSHRNTVVSYKGFKRFPFIKDVEIETSIDISNQLNLLLILWGFYLLPKNRKPYVALILSVTVFFFLFLIIYKMIY